MTEPALKVYILSYRSLDPHTLGRHKVARMEARSLDEAIAECCQLECQESLPELELKSCDVWQPLQREPGS